MSTIDDNWILEELKKATKNLTITTIEDLDSVIGEASLDELALDFDNILEVATPFLLENDHKGLVILRDIDEHLELISGIENEHLWTARAFLEDSVWDAIRLKAKAAIEYFNWY